MSAVLLFGGSFDPIHVGHVGVAQAAAERLRAERVLLIPAAIPPHKQNHQLASAAHRLAMCRLAVAGDPLFEVSDWELSRSGPSYTLHTVLHFRAALPGWRLFWLIGMDSLAELATWHRAAELADACELVTVRRPGQMLPDLAGALSGVLSAEQIARLLEQVLDTPTFDISATQIRARVQAGSSLEGMVAPAVAEYIAQHRLYLARSATTAAAHPRPGCGGG